MKKKLLVFLTCIVMIMSFAGCGASMSYDDYDLNEYIEVGKYKGLKADGYKIVVKDSDVESKIDEALEGAAKATDIGEGAAIKNGDTVNIDYVGTKDGEKFDGGSAEGYDLVIGSGSFIDGFESGLLGKKTGETVELELTFPEDYSAADLAGQDVVFTVTINSAKRTIKPEYNLDFVKNNTDYDSVKAYENALEKQIYDEKEQEAIAKQQEELWSQALENTTIKKYPEREVNHYIEFNDKQMDTMAKSYGVTRETLLEQYGFASEEDFDTINDESSKLRVKQEMLLEYIADKEGLEYTSEEAEQMLADFEKQGYDEKAIQEQTGRAADEYIHIELIYQKVLEFLVDNAQIK